MRTIDEKNYKQIKKKIKIFLLKNLIDGGYKKAEIYDNISKAFDRSRKDLLTQNNEPKYKIPLAFTYNRTLPNVKERIKKHLNILQINNKFEGSLSEPLVMCFCRNKHLKDFLWTKPIVKKGSKGKIIK